MTHDRGLLSEIERDLLSGRPLADTLRKCVILGGKAGSVELREWATRELRGYDLDDEDLPAYRTVGAPILADAVTGNAIVKRQLLGASSLPNFAQEYIGDEFTFRIGVGEIEAMIQRADATNGSIDLSLPEAPRLGSLMDHESGNPFQHINALYWCVSSASMRGIIDQVRTTLAELVAEMRAGMPRDAELPSAEIAAQAVNVAVHGDRSRVVVTNAQASGSSVASTAPPSPDGPYWTFWRKMGAALVGLATIVAGVIAVLQWL